MSRRALALSFLLALVLSLVASLPLRLVLAAGARIDPEVPGLSADGASGSIWSGRLRSVEWRGRALGDAAIALDPLSLLGGVQRLGLVTPEFSADLLHGRRAGIDDANGSLALDLHGSLPGLVARLSVADVSLVFSDGRCRQAGGNVEVELIAPGLDQTIGLSGLVRCDGDSGLIALASLPGAAGVEADLTIEGDGHYQLRSRIQPSADLDGSALQAAGFRQTPAGLVRTDSGRWPD